MATIEENLQKLNDTKINIKNAIVAKGVSMDNVPFTDYSSKIAQIETGGGDAGDGQYKVRVIDYDGTILKEENLNTGDTFTLPDAPTHDRLTFQEWSATDTITGNTVTVTDRDIQIGAVYKTTSGNTEFDIVLTKVTGLTVNLQNLTGMTSINWGDGTTNNSFSHTYSDYGGYTIEVAGVTALGVYIFDQDSRVKNYYCVAARLSDSVTSIGTNAFAYCSSLTSITIPSSVTTIGISAFYYCYSLTSITIPSSVTSIGNNAFTSCYSLTSITIPSSVTTIGISAFYYCYSLTSITIPSSVTSIGNNAFEYCSSLTSITIPSSVTSIGNSAFYNCKALTSVTLPNSITSIGSAAFRYCSSLTSITIPSSVTSIGNNAFTSCSSLTSITIPSSVTSIGNSAFASCYSLTSITIPSSVTHIGTSAFEYCYSLTSITIPSSVIHIGNYAFTSCYSLTSITIPSSVTSILDSVFQYCYSITKYDFTSSTSVPTLSNTRAFTDINDICKIYVPDELYDEWIAATNWATYADYIYKASEMEG